MTARTKGSDVARVVVPTDLVGVTEAAQLLGLDPSNIRRAIYDGRLAPLAELPERSKYIFDRQDLLAYAKGEPPSHGPTTPA